MQVQRTIPVTIPADAAVVATVLAFQRVQQAVSRAAAQAVAAAGGAAARPPTALDLHRSCYAQARGAVSAQMTCTAIRLVAGAYRSAWRKGHATRRPFSFRRPLAVWLIGPAGRDATLPKGTQTVTQPAGTRTVTWAAGTRAADTPGDGALSLIVSLWTVAGRRQFPLRVPHRFRDQLAHCVRVDSLSVRAGGAPGAAVRAWLTVTGEAPDPAGTAPVGIDRGALNALVAVDEADRTLFIGGRGNQRRNARTRRVWRQVLRRKAEKRARGEDTRSVRRLLKRLSRKQHDRNRTFAQACALALCRWAPPGAVLVFEDLNVGPNPPARRGQEHGRLSAWPHGLLRRCIECKAAEWGIAVTSVSPAFTSTTCSRCGDRGRRRRHGFVCGTCGHAEHADVNAARNVRDRHGFAGLIGLQRAAARAALTG